MWCRSLQQLVANKISHGNWWTMNLQPWTQRTTRKMSNNTPWKRTTQFLLLIVLETEPLVFASLVSEGRQIVVRVCQHPDSPVQCKQPRVSMQTVVSDHTAAGRSAVCLSDRPAQSAPALQFKLWRLGHPGGWKEIQGGGGQVQKQRGNKMFCVEM